MEKEIWKDSSVAIGYEVSNFGNIRKKGRKNNRTPQDNGNGYKYIRVKEKGKPKNYYIHRLVATEFCPNPYGYNQINHLDGQRGRNCSSNLEWCTPSQNIRYSYDVLGRQNSEKQKDAARKTLYRINADPKIRKKRLAKRMERYWLLPKEVRVARQKYMIEKNKRPIRQYSLEWEELKVYQSAKDAERDTGICASNIGLCCRGGISRAGNYHWEYVDKPSK